MEEVFKDMRDDRFKNQLTLEKPLYGVLTWGIVKTSEEKFEALKKEIVRARFDFDESSCTPDGILITNLSRADVQYFADHFGKKDFIYGERTLSEITGYYQLDMEFWEYEETTKYNITTHSTSVTEYLDIYEDKTEKLDDFMARHYFSFSDSFSNVLNSASRNIFQKYSWKEPRQFLREVETYLTEHDKYTGLAQWRYRARMLHKPQTWEFEDGTSNAYYEMWIKNQTQN